MSQYSAPLRDMHFALTELAGLAQVAALPGYEEAGPDTAEAILDEAAKFASQVLAPINAEGDRIGCTWNDGSVTTPPGCKDAYAQFVEGGWNGLEFPQAYGGQGLPKLVSSPVKEMVMSANLAFSLCSLLTGGAIEALLLTGSDEQKQRYLPALVEGRWTGTMNLTEPQAGSDLGLVRTRAEPDGAGRYRLYGQKIFITHGEHDMAENIVHLVLARLPGAPEGVKGISLFLVPKFLVNDDGSLGARNDVRCVSIEHKLGIHASPTAVLAFGDCEGASGWLVGEPNRGLEYMFIMMNEARYAVGLQGVAIAERAYQHALSYAKERVQCKDVTDPRGKSVAIIRHADVRRMLMTKALTESTRAVAYVVGAAIDTAHASPDAAERERARAFAEFMIPIHKGWATEASIDVANLAIQVHGGMGFIEETGVAQHLRDARILTIYEGTTGIQANDLIGRKIARDRGAVAQAVAGQMRATLAELPGDGDAAAIRRRLVDAVDAFEACADWIAAHYASDPKAVHAGAVPFLKLAGLVCGGWQMARAAAIAQRKLAAGEGDADFLRAKLGTARFYADHLLSQAVALREAVLDGAAGVLALAEEQF